MSLREIKQSVGALTPNKLRKLDAWLHELLNTAEPKKHDRAAKKRKPTKEHKATNKTYRLEGVRCGNPNCKCADGQLHGPYWYAYWSENGRTRSQYIGKQLNGKLKRTVSGGSGVR
jgi:hypothetical protein